MEAFEYAVIRIVPAVEREEFINAGVVLYCKSRRYLGIEISLNEKLLTALCPQADVSLIKEYLQGFVAVAKGEKCKSPIAALDAASRFRWLTAVRSTMIQTSRIHTGITDAPKNMLHNIFREQVLRDEAE